MKNIEKIIKKSVVVGMVSAMVSIPAFGGTSVQVRVDGVAKNPSISPVVVNHITLIPMNDIFSAMGAKINWNSAETQVTVELGAESIVFSVDSREAIVNGITKNMPLKAEMMEGNMMVPLRFVSDEMGIGINWDRDSRQITIQSNKSGASKAEIENDESKARNLSYDEALRRAISRNSNLQKLSESMDLMEESRSDTLESYHNLNVHAEQQVIGMIRGIKSLEIQMRNRVPNETILKETTEYMLRNYVGQIETYELDMQLIKEKIKIDERNVKNLELKKEMGLTSASEVTAAKQTLERTESSLESLGIALRNEELLLKNFLGISGAEKVRVSMEEREPEVRVSDINIYTRTKISQAPTLKILDNAIEMAEYNMNTHNGLMTLAESTLQKETDLAQAKRERSDAERKLDQSIKQTYNTLNQLKESRKMLELDLEVAKENQEKIRASFQAGLVTMTDVESSDLAILNAEIALKKNIISYASLAFAFEKPYLLP